MTLESEIRAAVRAAQRARHEQAEADFAATVGNLFDRSNAASQSMLDALDTTEDDTK